MQTSVSVCHDMASHPEMLTDKELTSVTASFKALESGLRGATIKQEVGQVISRYNAMQCTWYIHVHITFTFCVQNVQKAMLMVGLNPSDQECVDIPNEWARKGLLYFPDFCNVVLEGFRPSEEEEEDFYQHTFKVGQ